jgi:hypothetical protein
LQRRKEKGRKGCTNTQSEGRRKGNKRKKEEEGESGIDSLFFLF